MFVLYLIGGISIIVYIICILKYRTDDNPFNDFKSKIKFNKNQGNYEPLAIKSSLCLTVFKPRSIGYWFSEWFELEIEIQGTKDEWNKFKLKNYDLDFGFTQLEESFGIIHVYGYSNESRQKILYSKGTIDDITKNLCYEKTIYVK